MMLSQRLVPGIVGISTYVDYVYQTEMQRTAVAAAGTAGPINQLRTVTVTIDFSLLVRNLQTGQRDAAEEQVAVAARALELAGSDFIVVTSGTTSTLTARARERVTIPFLDLAEACWKQAPPAPVGLLSTRYAAEGGIFHAAAQRHGSTILLPSPDSAARVDQAIFNELVYGTISAAGLRIFCQATEELGSLGARSVILGNTDMTLVAEDLKQKTDIPLIDAARAHARDAALTALVGL